MHLGRKLSCCNQSSFLQFVFTTFVDLQRDQFIHTFATVIIYLWRRGFGPWVHLHPLCKKTFKNFSKCQKILKKKSDIHQEIVCQPKKFRGEKTFFVICAKKTKTCPVQSHFVLPEFVFFARLTKNIFSPRDFLCQHKMS